MNEQFWGDMLTVLKDIGSYLEKQDTTQERAKIGTPPKISENPKPIKGADMPSGFKPAEKIAKEYVPIDEAKDRDTEEINAKEQTLLKEDEFPEEETGEEYAEEETGEEENPEFTDEEETEEEPVEDTGEAESMDELKSLLKDIRSALMKQSNVNDVVKAEIKKALPNIVKGETDKMLRKMGFVPTRSDITKLDVTKSFGIDANEETKGSSEIKKSVDKQTEVTQIVNNMTQKTWAELGQLREKTDGFNPFSR